jgi:hypothetical protein
VDATTLLAVLLPITASVVAGGLTVAWKLGGLDKAVQILSEAVRRLEQEIHNGRR